MRQITMQAASSLMNGKNFKRGNTHVVNNSLYLFGNKIAELRDGELWITSAGWKTNTTKERLNGLPGVNIFQKNKTWYLNNHTWNGEWVRIKTKQNCFTDVANANHNKNAKVEFIEYNII